MKIWVITFGSTGDVYPFIALGLELQRRGHAVTLLTSDFFEDEVRNAGLDFVPWYSAKETADVINRAGPMRPNDAFERMYREVLLPLAFLMYGMIAECYRPGEMALVASTFCFGARLAQEKLGVPLVTVHLQPYSFRSAYEPPLPRLLRAHPWTPGWVRRAWFNRRMKRTVGADLNAFRRTLGLPPTARIFDRWLHSTRGVLGLFPEWFAAPRPDWPPNTYLSGFPLYDSPKRRTLSDDLRRFLNTGEPPVTFTAGTDMKPTSWFFEAAVGACERLACRGLLINAFRNQVPKDLPPNIRYARYAPFSDVFPASRVVVHHGGIGTTAQAMAAGVPQVVVPSSFDQPDHAVRVARLGVGKWIAPRQCQAQGLSGVLSEIFQDTQMAARARNRARAMNPQEAMGRAGDVVEDVIGRSVLS